MFLGTQHCREPSQSKGREADRGLGEMSAGKLTRLVKLKLTVQHREMRRGPWASCIPQS